MRQRNVLVADYAWADLEIERAILADVAAKLIVAEDPAPAQLARLAQKHRVDAIMTTWAEIPREVICASDQCRHVARFGIGLNNIDVACCTERDIIVTNVPDYCLTEVAEHTLALILSLARNVAQYHLQTKQGRYDLQSLRAPRRIAGQTLGIVGLGNIGRVVAEKAAAFGFHVIASHNPHRNRPPSDIDSIARVPLDELLSRSDFVSLHLPLCDATHHIIGTRELAMMKNTAYLINTARGGLVDHEALARALSVEESGGQIAGAALDVQDPEPPDLKIPPFNDLRVIVTPHSAFVSTEAVEDLRRRTAQQVAAKLSGGVPPNVVNPNVLGRS